jgi:CMP/dCMP kinase
MIIAIDGPSAAGKGTLAARLAQAYGLRRLDTGTLYRAVALTLLASGRDPGAEEAAQAAAKVDLAGMDDAALRTPEVGRVASIVAAFPAVRAALIEAQRDFAAQGRAVIDGRDIGTVIWPQAEVKLFVSASPEARAMRRWQEHQARGEALSLERVAQDLATRDARDAARDTAPLMAAPDAHLLDTSALGIEEVVEIARRIVDAAITPPRG